MSSIKTVKITNVSLSASKRDINEFFSFSGEIDYVEMQSESENSQLAFVTFKDPEGAYTAVLLTGATIIDRSVSITPAENYQLPPNFYHQKLDPRPLPTHAAVKKTEDIVSTMLAKGVFLGKDVINKAKTFDEQHQLSSNAAATVSSLDHRFDLSGKICMGTAIVSGKAREVDERFQVSEITKSAFVAAEQKVTSASIAIMSNHYVSTGASWVSNALSKVAKTAADVREMTREKLEKAEEARQETINRERRNMVSEYALLHLDDSAEAPNAAAVTMESRKLKVLSE